MKRKPGRPGDLRARPEAEPLPTDHPNHIEQPRFPSACATPCPAFTSTSADRVAASLASRPRRPKIHIARFHLCTKTRGVQYHLWIGSVARHGA
jgi:hypothetical protein